MTVVAWLSDADPSIRWQVVRDLTDAPAEAMAAERWWDDGRRAASSGASAVSAG